MALNRTNIKYIQNKSNTLELTWIINNICTNSCRYCPPSLWSGKNHHYEWENAKQFLERLMETHKKIICSISGGEPTVSPFFPELVEMLYNNHHTIQITTNGARSVRYWKKIAPMLDNICWSYHAAMMKEEDEEKWIEKVVESDKTACSNAVRVMLDSDRWDRCLRFCDKLKAANVRHEVVRIYAEQARSTNIGENYTREMESWMESYGFYESERSDEKQKAIDIKNSSRPERVSNDITVVRTDGTIENDGVDLNEIVVSKNNIYKGWSCNIGIESLFVHYDGFVKKGNCLQGGNLFHIDNHKNYMLPSSGEICTQDLCMCTTDVGITKAPLFDPDSQFYQKNFTARGDYEKKRRRDNMESILTSDLILVKQVD